MNIVKKIVLNSSYVIVGRVLNILLRLVPVILMIRYLGSELYGVYSFVLAFVYIFAVFADLGIDKILIREISKNKDKLDEYVGSIVVLKIIIVFILIFVIIIVSKMLNLSEIKFIGIVITSFFLIFYSLIVPCSAYFRVNLEMQYPMLATLLGSITFIILILWFINMKLSIYYFFLAYVISYMVNTMFIYFFSIKFHEITPKIDTKNWKYFIKISISLGIISIFSKLNDRIGILILSWLKDDKAVGYFTAPLAITTKLEIIPFAVMLSLFPFFSKFYKSSKDKWEKSFELSFKYMLILSMFPAVISTIYSKEIIILIFGDEFLKSSSVFSILMWGLVFLFLNFVLIDVITSAGRQKILIPIFGFTFISTIIVNVILVPEYSFLGTAAAYVMSKLIVTLLCIYYLFTRLSLYPKPSILIKIMISTILLLGILSYIHISLWLAIPLITIIYIILLFSFKILDINDINLFKKGY